MTFIYFSSFPCYSLLVIKKEAVIHMKINNNSNPDEVIDKNDTPMHSFPMMIFSNFLILKGTMYRKSRLLIKKMVFM